MNDKWKENEVFRKRLRHMWNYKFVISLATALVKCLSRSKNWMRL